MFRKAGHHCAHSLNKRLSLQIAYCTQLSFRKSWIDAFGADLHSSESMRARDLSQLGELWFDIVTIYAEDPTGPVPTPPFPGSRDRLVRSMVLAVLPHFTGPRRIDGRAWTASGSFHHWPLGTPLRS